MLRWGRGLLPLAICTVALVSFWFSHIHWTSLIFTLCLVLNLFHHYRLFYLFVVSIWYIMLKCWPIICNHCQLGLTLWRGGGGGRGGRGPASRGVLQVEYLCVFVLFWIWYLVHWIVKYHRNWYGYHVWSSSELTRIAWGGWVRWCISSSVALQPVQSS